jgi:hypothetical protein
MSIEILSADLPGVAGEYFAAANSLNIDRTTALFTDEACVTDEGKSIYGRAAIHEWVARTIREFSVTATPEHVNVRDGLVAVTALVSGRFPGSPVRLTFRFTVAGDRIAGLDIQ